MMGKSIMFKKKENLNDLTNHELAVKICKMQDILNSRNKYYKRLKELRERKDGIGKKVKIDKEVLVHVNCHINLFYDTSYNTASYIIDGNSILKEALDEMPEMLGLKKEVEKQYEEWLADYKELQEEMGLDDATMIQRLNNTRHY